MLEQAKSIVQNGWKPAFIMIDKCRAAMNALSQKFPGIPIRICQFHVMQAILRWDRDEGNINQPKPTLNLQRKHMLLYAVRELQRCRTEARWPMYVAAFERCVRQIVAGSSTSFDTIMEHFRSNWFVPAWRDKWIDIGLPTGRNRDRMLSTNNWTERAFKTFDQIFLENRANKSAFRLVHIIVHDWFPYYAQWEPKDKQLNKNLIKVAQDGHAIWSTPGAIVQKNRRDGRRAWMVSDLHARIDS